MEKERQIRARVEGIYCKERGDFDSLEAWNNYLEEKEDVMFNLVEGVDVQATEVRLQAYLEANAAGIAEHQARVVAGEQAGAAGAGPGPGPSQAAADDPEGAKRMSIQAARQEMPTPFVEEYMGEPGNPGHEQLQKKLALWASGWSLDTAREKAVQGAYASVF